MNLVDYLFVLYGLSQQILVHESDLKQSKLHVLAMSTSILDKTFLCCANWNIGEDWWRSWWYGIALLSIYIDCYRIIITVGISNVTILISVGFQIGCFGVDRVFLRFRRWRNLTRWSYLCVIFSEKPMPISTDCCNGFGSPRPCLFDNKIV